MSEYFLKREKFVCFLQQEFVASITSLKHKNGGPQQI